MEEEFDVISSVSQRDERPKEDYCAFDQSDIFDFLVSNLYSNTYIYCLIHIGDKAGFDSPSKFSNLFMLKRDDIKENCFNFLEKVMREYNKMNNKYLGITAFKKYILELYLEPRTVKNLNKDNQYNFFKAVFEISLTNFLGSLKNRSKNTYFIFNYKQNEPYLLNLMKDELHKTFDICAYRLTNKTSYVVPKDLYDKLGADYAELTEKYNKLLKKYKHLRRQFQEDDN